jgi:hypothetical protein
VSDVTHGVVDIFTGTKQTGQITGLRSPQGIATDVSGTLYVANSGADNVEEFAPPYANSPTATIADTGGSPVDVAVAGDGVVAILNICAGRRCNLPGSVDFYAKGNTTMPCATVSGGAATPTILFGAFDDAGTLYLGGLTVARTTQIARITGECKATTLTALTTSNAIAFPGSIQVDHRDDIAILDASLREIDIYAPPVNSAMLTLVSTHHLLDTFDALGFALTSNGADLYTADGGAKQSMEYPYPGGGASILRLTPHPPGQFESVAVTPVESP